MFIKKIKKFFKEKYIIIYQMGKVGSRSLVLSLENAGINHLSMHSFIKHINLSQFEKYTSVNYYYRLNKRIFYRVKFSIIRIMVRLKKKNLKIISVIREPISRNMSFYFQDIQIPLMDIHMKEETTISSEIGINTLINDFKKNFNHYCGIDWFDNEFLHVLGVDVFKHNFDTEKGFCKFTDKGYDILIVQLEKLNSLEKELLDFIGESNFEIKNENNSLKKWYSSVYKEFISRIEFSETYLSSIYESKFCMHFYSQEDIKQFISKYSIESNNKSLKIV